MRRWDRGVRRRRRPRRRCGLGGPSLAIAYTGSHGPNQINVTMDEGTAGGGGPAVDPDFVSAQGEDGIAAEQQALLP
jgi:hypothetical protein